MTKYWCVNFDLVLNRGLDQRMWMMQYQYAHDGYEFQERTSGLSAIARNWNALKQVEAGDWLAAYLRNSKFHAIGEVIERRDRSRHSGVQKHADSVERTVRERCHAFLDGLVLYADAPVLYEDFADAWNRPVPDSYPGQPRAWHYNQRIDVREWHHIVYQGVQVPGLRDAAPRGSGQPALRQAAFQISKEFFDVVEAALRNAAL